MLLFDTVSYYIYGLGDTPLASWNPATNGYEYFHQDGLGSTRAVTDGGGVVLATYDYDPFGGKRQGASSGTLVQDDVAFTGEPRDAQTGLYNLRARLYDPATGRFTAPDPLGYAGGSNLYAYARNAPSFRADHSGLGGPEDEGMEEEEVAGRGASGAGGASQYSNRPPGLPGLSTTGGEQFPGGRTLPKYTGGKTVGNLEVEGEIVELQSSKHGPSTLVPRGPGSGMNGTIMYHVEAHAAAVMRLIGVRSARLFINQQPCSSRAGGCEQNLPFMLPEGAELEVFGPNGFQRTYVGLPDRRP